MLIYVVGDRPETANEAIVLKFLDNEMIVRSLSHRLSTLNIVNRKRI